LKLKKQCIQLNPDWDGKAVNIKGVKINKKGNKYEPLKTKPFRPAKDETDNRSERSESHASVLSI
jgi:hypothetical protein